MLFTAGFEKKEVFQVTQYACTRTSTCALSIIGEYVYIHICISWLISVRKNIYAEYVDKYFIWRSWDLDLKEYYHFNTKTMGSKIQRSLGALSRALPPQSCMAPFCRKLGYGNCSKSWCHAGVVQCANIHNYKFKQHIYIYLYLYHMNTFHSKKQRLGSLGGLNSKHVNQLMWRMWSTSGMLFCWHSCPHYFKQK